MKIKTALGIIIVIMAISLVESKSSIADMITASLEGCCSSTVISSNINSESNRKEKEMYNQILAVSSKENKVMEYLDHITNEIGPRLSGSRNLEEASKWAVNTFEELGLSNVHTEKCGEIPVRFIRGEASGSITVPFERDLHFSSQTWSPGTNGTVERIAIIAPIEIAAIRQIEIPEQGAFLFVPAIREKKQREAYIKEIEKLAENKSIAGIVTPSSGELIHTTGNFRISWDNLPRVPQITLLQKEWATIISMVEMNQDVTVRFNIDNRFEEGPVPLHNIIADIPGSESPDEYVILGAHLDSWDGATGAQDDGTGCAAIFEAARLLMKADAKPKRTIRFLLFSAEEQGLFGSRHYVESHPEIHDKISAALIMDAGGNPISGLSVTGEMSKDINAIFAGFKSQDSKRPFTVAAEGGISLGSSDCCAPASSPPAVKIESSCCSSSPEPEAPATIPSAIIESSSSCCEGGSGVSRTDAGPFLAAGIPGFLWNQSGKSSFARYHHTQFDTYESVNAEDQKHSSTVMAIGALGIANLPGLLSREGLNESNSQTRNDKPVDVSIIPDKSVERVEPVTSGSSCCAPQVEAVEVKSSCAPGCTTDGDVSR